MPFTPHLKPARFALYEVDTRLGLLLAEAHTVRVKAPSCTRETIQISGEAIFKAASAHKRGGAEASLLSELEALTEKMRGLV